MEVPRHWREMPTNMRFTGREKKLGESGNVAFKFPGGEIPMVGELAEIRERFVLRGFKPEVADEILGRFFTVASEATVANGEIVERFLELLGSEIRK